MKNISRSSVKQSRRSTPLFSDDRITQGVALVNEGMFWKDAAAAVGMSMDNLRRRAKLLKLEVRTGHLTSKRPSALQMPNTQWQLGYLAAIVDGEGHICIEDKNHRAVHVGITNTNVNLLDWLSTIGGRVTWKHYTSQRLGTQQCGVWQIQARQDTLDFLTHIEPFMMIKRDKAQRAIAQLNIWLNESTSYYKGH